MPYLIGRHGRGDTSGYGWPYLVCWP